MSCSVEIGRICGLPHPAETYLLSKVSFCIPCRLLSVNECLDTVYSCIEVKVTCQRELLEQLLGNFSYYKLSDALALVKNEISVYGTVFVANYVI